MSASSVPVLGLDLGGSLNTEQSRRVTCFAFASLLTTRFATTLTDAERVAQWLYSGDRT